MTICHSLETANTGLANHNVFVASCVIWQFALFPHATMGDARWSVEFE